eukprot:4575114-Pyramimonas_sp.AAC.1
MSARKRPAAAGGTAPPMKAGKTSQPHSGTSPLARAIRDMLEKMGPSKTQGIEAMLKSYGDEVCVYSLCSGSEIQGFCV